MTDTILWEQVRNGSQTALVQIYGLYRHRLHRFCSRIVNDGDAADDIVQNVFVKLHTDHRTIRDAQALRSWMFTVARNGALEELRRRKGEPLDDELVWDGQLPDELLSGEDRRTIVERALLLIHPSYREALVLREYEELSYEEIATITGSTVGTVRSRLFKARKALLQIIEPLMKE